MAKLCPECLKPLPARKTPAGNNQIRHPDCARIAHNRERMEIYYRSQRAKAPKPVTVFATVYYPDVILPDYWSRKDYDMYKHDLPAGATVHYD